MTGEKQKHGNRAGNIHWSKSFAPLGVIRRNFVLARPFLDSLRYAPLGLSNSDYAQFLKMLGMLQSQEKSYIEVIILYRKVVICQDTH